ncbi:hypothetical protein M3612_16490 [Niallia taxi]|uniref:hypothetical protein n=1 Tax=Niallia taxi TaxID=2499688 RepID=UPI00203AD505|nr:hypothetical protein [Niallia taxi]MCM3216098.1 hypothetical protein [Niallia taxi]
MSIIQVLQTAFKGEGLKAPKLSRIDKIESSGSLLLIDVSKSDLSGQVIAGQSYPNLFANNALAITEAETSVKVERGIVDATKAKIERTAKGGIHFISKNGEAMGTGNFVDLAVTGGIKQHLVTHHKDHSFYFSIWGKLTNKGNAAFYPAAMTSLGNHNFNRAFYMQYAPSQPVGAFLNAVPNQWVEGSPPGIGTPFNIFNGGYAGLNQASGSTRLYESMIFYRFYMEDLTVSGRTFAEAQSIDQQLFNAAFVVGGKFADDTYTDPLTAF